MNDWKWTNNYNLDALTRQIYLQCLPQADSCTTTEFYDRKSLSRTSKKLHEPAPPNPGITWRLKLAISPPTFAIMLARFCEKRWNQTSAQASIRRRVSSFEAEVFSVKNSNRSTNIFIDRLKPAYFQADENEATSEWYPWYSSVITRCDSFVQRSCIYYIVYSTTQVRVYVTLDIVLPTWVNTDGHLGKL